MPPEAFALGAALLFVLGKVAIKFGTEEGDVVLGFVLTLSTSVVVIAMFSTFFVGSWSVSWGTAALFAVGGLCGPGLGRFLGIWAVREAGASVAVPVQSSVNPILSSILGVIIFDEVVTLGRAAALGLVIVGIWACVRGGSANRRPRDIDPQRLGLVLLLPLGAGVAYAGLDTFTKVALASHPEPVLGALIGTSSALAVWTVIILSRRRLRSGFRVDRSVRWFLLSGLISAMAMMLLFIALRDGELSVVAPIISSQPVLMVVMSGLVLRNLERLRVGTILGAIVGSVGVALLTLG